MDPLNVDGNSWRFSRMSEEDLRSKFRMDNRNIIVVKTSEVIAKFQGFRHHRITRDLCSELSDVFCDNPPGGALNSIYKNEDMEVEIYPDSDVEDPDVKVCGICGDEGRKDLLVICSRCCDWAEHTYCMLKVPTKVPEGNWVCLECKVEEKLSNQRQDKIGRIDGNVKKQLP